MEPGKDTMSSANPLESIKKKELFTYAMEGKWKAVVKMYKEVPRVHNTQITRSGDTALHIAVSDGEEEVVKQMVDSICSVTLALQHRKEALQTENERGNIALHAAASMGNSKMCEIIATVEPSLVNCRNADDLAFQIINLYKDLVTSVNQDGLSPLHLLAAKPSAFRSGSRLGRTEIIIYHCMFVEELKVADPWRSQTADKDEQAINQYFPDNYNILWDIFSVIKSVVTTVARKGKESQPNSTKEPEKAKNYHTAARGSDVEAQRHKLFPANYRTCYDLFKFFYLALLVILGQGLSKLNKIRRKKEKHTWSVQIMNALLDRASDYQYEDNGSKPDIAIPEELSSLGAKLSTAKGNAEKDSKKRKKETPILIAAKNGVMEIVKRILILFPVAIYDLNEEKKNIALLAVEKRQPHVYKLLLEKNFFKESLFRQVDNEGNSALHLAAKLGPHKPWLISGAALQMQWEIKWFEFVKTSMPPHFFVHYNKNYKTPKDIFTETHSDLVQSGGEWLTKTSESCSLVATLVATVAFASSTTVPGGVGENGRPVFVNEPAFDLFAISSLVALCFSIISTVMFLSILTSRYQEFDFNKDLPGKLILGMSSLFMSIASMLVSFCAGHFFVLKDQFRHAALPLYLVTSFPVTLFALAQFPLYFDLLRATFKHVPQRSYKATPVMEYVPDMENKKIGEENNEK